VIDVYRKVHSPLKKFWDYQLYIILFPKLIAGPIVRYHEIADQISDRSANETVDNRLTGFYRFIIGLGKKVLIANVVGKYADTILNMDPHQLNAWTAWAGILGYTFQIYFDFSGYSDMAIGIGKMIGFKFPENFNNPYTSGSITEFWRRWHMTLGSWMRNYLYIPLGGNRVNSKFRLYLNLWLVFLASGLWHGASWNFVIWGAYHGLFLVLEKSFLLRFYEKVGRIPRVAVTFVVVVIGWVFFRLETFSAAMQYFQAMFSFVGNGKSFFINREFSFILMLSALFSFFTLMPAGARIQENIYGSFHGMKGHLAYTLLAFALLTLSLSSITSADFNPFIYFRF
jgi:alginate O-acetyltransferase complex protein AlgI